jgi:parallel beta-helix repeat protein
MTIQDNRPCTTSAQHNETLYADYGGFAIYYSTGNTVAGCKMYNDTCGVLLCNSNGNTFYGNSFINNDDPAVSDQSYPYENASAGYYSINSWDNGVIGNYWSEYNGTDTHSGPYQNMTGSDGIGDTPYIIDASNTDHYPLMGPFTDFNIAQGVNVQVVSNSTVSGFQFNGTAVIFNVTQENGATGFCRVGFPTALINGTLTVFINGTEVPYNSLPESNNTENYIYFTYSHSTEQVTIVPEFPTFILLLFFMIATLMAILFYKKKAIPCKSLQST